MKRVADTPLRVAHEKKRIVGPPPRKKQPPLKARAGTAEQFTVWEAQADDSGGGQKNGEYSR